MVSLAGYFDASGHPDQGSLLVVGGFISFENRWQAFEPRWNKVLAEAGITCFHMSEFINRKGEFIGWKQRKRERFLGALAQIVVETVVWNFASTVVLTDWNKINQDYKLAENNFQPYALAGWSCVQRTLGWCKDHVYQPPLFFFEYGDKHQTQMQRRVEKDFGIIARTALKKAQKDKPNELPVIELQTADFAAWQILNLLRHVQDGYRLRTEVSAVMEPWLWIMFNKLFAAVRYDQSHFSLTPPRNATRPASLIRLCDEYKIPRRN